MNDAVMWLVMAGALVICEIFTGTFYLLMLALGMLAGAAAAGLGWSNPLQMLSAASLGAVSVVLLYLRRRTLPASRDAANDPNVNLDIGQVLQVEHWTGQAPGPWQARVSYRGAQWDVELERGETPLPGAFVIRSVHGSRLMVAAAR